MFAKQPNMHQFELIKAYHQVLITEDYTQKTTIKEPFSVDKYTRMPFRLRNTARFFSGSLLKSYKICHSFIPT